MSHPYKARSLAQGIHGAGERVTAAAKRKPQGELWALGRLLANAAQLAQHAEEHRELEEAAVVVARFLRSGGYDAAPAPAKAALERLAKHVTYLLNEPVEPEDGW